MKYMIIQMPIKRYVLVTPIIIGCDEKGTFLYESYELNITNRVITITRVAEIFDMLQLANYDILMTADSFFELNTMLVQMTDCYISHSYIKPEKQHEFIKDLKSLPKIISIHK